MPKALSNFGLLGGVLGILILGLIFILSTHLLFEISKGIAKRIKLERDVRRLLAVQETVKSLIKKAQKRAAKEAKREEKRKKNKNPEDWKRKFKDDFEQGHSSNDPGSSIEESNPDTETENSQDKGVQNGDQATSKIPLSPIELRQLGASVEILDRLGNREGGEEEIDTILRSNPDTETENSQDKGVQNGDQATSKIPLSPNESRQLGACVEILNQLGNRERDEEEIDKILRSLHYPKLVEWSFNFGANDMKWATKYMKYYVKVMLLATHIGCCCVCFLFIAECLSEMPTTAKYVTHSGSFVLLAYALPVMICLSFIPDRHEQTGVATIAFLLQISGVVMMFWFFLTGRRSKNYHPYFAPADTWSLFFGIVFYAFEGTGVTLHLESHMENRKAFRGATGVFNKGMVFMVFLFSFFGLFGYWKYGDDVKTSVSFNLPEGRFADLAQFMTALGVLLTYPFHFSFVLTPVKKIFINEGSSKNFIQFLDLFVRAFLVIFTYFLSAVVPYLELQISILGGTASCFLTLILPSLMYLNTVGELPGVEYSCCRVLFFFMVFLLGTAGTVLGAYMTIKNLPLYYPNGGIFG